MAQLVLRVQATAGNATVSRVLAGLHEATWSRSPVTPIPAPLQRFVGPEHQSLGDATGRGIDLGDGVVLSWGQIVAIAGDEYGSLDELMADVKTEKGRYRLRAALLHDRVPGAVAAQLAPPSGDQGANERYTTAAAAQDQRYIELAMRNTAHFPDGGLALGAWAQYHAAAIDAALQAGLANNAQGINAAYANEAFGQHFLTDCFSGGHIRTPRSLIVDWYVQTWAPRVTGPLVERLRTRLIEALVAEANPQTNWPDFIIRAKIAGRVNPGIDGAIAGLGGLPALTEWVGLGVAGALSGAMHDAEGEQGVLVASDDHPESWRAYGDTRLDFGGNATSKATATREEATKAVLAAKADVDLAYRIGEQQAAERASVSGEPPERVHFAFASSTLTPEASAAVHSAATYMVYRPSSALDLIGHTDPIGSDASNDDLGMRRAEAVGAALMAEGVASTRVRTLTRGEQELVTTDPREYRRNRRTEFVWRSSSVGQGDGNGAQSDADRASSRAGASVAAQIGPPYKSVNPFIPRPVEERAGASLLDGNAPLPEWHWGRLDATFRGRVDDWIRTMVGTKLTDAVNAARQLNTITESGITLHPRDVIQSIVSQIMAQPTSTLGDLVGEAPSPAP